MTDTPGLDDAVEAAARAWLEPAARVSFSMESFRGTYPAAAVGRAVEAAYPVIVAATREAVAEEIRRVPKRAGQPEWSKGSAVAQAVGFDMGLAAAVDTALAGVPVGGKEQRA